MTDRDDGGPALPAQGAHCTRCGRTSDWGHTVSADGMTLRQWYVGHLAEGLMASGRWRQEEVEIERDVAAWFRIADAMLAHERKEREEAESD